MIIESILLRITSMYKEFPFKQNMDRNQLIKIKGRLKINKYFLIKS